MELKEYKTPQMEVVSFMHKGPLMVIAGSEPGKNEDPYLGEE